MMKSVNDGEQMAHLHLGEANEYVFLSWKIERVVMTPLKQQLHPREGHQQELVIVELMDQQRVLPHHHQQHQRYY